MAVINSGMRKAIKIMCVTAQTAQFLSLMPKPKDFVTRLVGDVVYLSSIVMKLSEDVNKLLDQYANIPTDYIMNQMNSITGSVTRIADRVGTYAQYAVDQGMGLTSNTMDLISNSTSTIIDTVKSTSNMVVSLGGTIAHTGSTVLGKTDVAEGIYDGVEEILEWNGEFFDSISNASTKDINNTIEKVNNVNTKVDEKISDVTNDVKNAVGKPKEFLENIISKLKEAMDKFSGDFESSFGFTNAKDTVTGGISGAVDALKGSGSNDPATQAAVAVLTTANDIFKNFSIMKVVKAFGGVLIQAGIVKLGLDELPPIDFERMLSNVRGQLEENLELSQEAYIKMANDVLGTNIKDLNELSDELKKELASQNPQYSSKEYKEFKKQFNDKMKKKRNELLQEMKQERDNQKRLKKEEREKRRIEEDDSVIKEQRKQRREAKAAKQTEKFKDVIKKELDNVEKEFKARSNRIKSDWDNMMKRYETAIKEIKGFFQNGGDGDMFIDDICDRINQDCDDIKELCKNLGVQLVSSTVKVVMPSDIGPVFPNPAYKISDLWMDIKIIIKFIKDLIELIIDIINQINKLARIMLNGLNSLKDIINQLMELLGIKWFMDLVQNIIEMFNGKISDIRELLENMLSPVYYKDTEEYENSLETIEGILNENTGNYEYTESLKQLGESNDRFWGHNFNELIENKITYNSSGFPIKYEKIHTGKIDGMDDKTYEKLIDELEAKGEEIVAYKSPIIDPIQKSASVDDVVNGGKTFNTDIKFIGWHFFHSKMRKEYSYGGLFGDLINKIKNKIIQKAAKTGNKKRGGIKGLKNRWKIKGEYSYDAFYWYTYYTLDLEKDCFVGMSAIQDKIYIDNVVNQQNGSIVEINDNGVKRTVFVADNMVRKGDYVNVNGIKYRVQ